MVRVGMLLHWEMKLFVGARYWRALLTYVLEKQYYKHKTFFSDARYPVSSLFN